MSGDRSKNANRLQAQAMNFAVLLFLSFAANSAFGTVYNLNNNIIGSGFYDAFVFEAIADPSHGRVYATSTPHYNRHSWE